MAETSGRDWFPEKVGVGGISKPDLLAILDEQDVQLNKAARALFLDERFEASARKYVVEVVACSVAELGFHNGATYEQLVTRARESGLTECPLELGPHLRLQLVDQPEGAEDGAPSRNRAPRGSLTVASPPLDDREETAKGFYLRRVEGVSWLRGYWSWAGHVWSPEDVLVFSRGASA